MERRTLTLRRVRLTDDTTTDVEVDEEAGTIVRVGQDLEPSGPGRAIDLKGYLLLPAPAEPHAHLDKAFLAERIPNPSGDLAAPSSPWTPTGRRSPPPTSRSGPSGRPG
jgi:cytosine deaminase